MQVDNVALFSVLGESIQSFIIKFDAGYKIFVDTLNQVKDVLLSS